MLDERQEVKSLKKALRTLEFLNIRGEATVTEVAQAIDVPRTTAYRLLGTLACEGYIDKQNHSDIYRLTSRIRALSRGFGDLNLAIEIAKPLIEKVGTENMWPIALATPDGAEMVVRVTTDFSSALALERFPIRSRVSMLHAPAGLCYLAYCEEKTAHEIITMALGTDADRRVNFEHMLSTIRAQGYCQVHFHQYPEDGVAVPLILRNGIAGAINMRYIPAAISDSKIKESYVPMLRQLAMDISTAYESARGPMDALERHRPMAVL
jgi:IclR family mhp operon transcriptional activator